jgi:hypothetical protein
MIENTLTGGYQSWDALPVATPEEVVAKRAMLRFSAETSLSEKVQRIFNGTMFFIVGAKLLTSLPGVTALSSVALNSVNFTAISGAAVLRIPTVLTVMAIAPKIIVTLALIVVIRKVMAVIIFHIIYPAVILSMLPGQKQEINETRKQNFEILSKTGYQCRRLTLHKSGIDYDAFAIQHDDIKDNWAIVAGGNGWIGENCLVNCDIMFRSFGFNLLFINGPGVGCSSGFPTSYSVGAGHEAGLQFLEKEVKAKNILIYGTSLGGGMQAEAIRQHADFKKDIRYVVWIDRSFDRLSNAARHMVTRLAKPVFFLLGIELDGIAAAKTLQKLQITQIVTQNNRSSPQNYILPLDGSKINGKGTDGVIPNRASLYLGLGEAGFKSSAQIHCFGSSTLDHNGNYFPEAMKQLIRSVLHPEQECSSITSVLHPKQESSFAHFIANLTSDNQSYLLEHTPIGHT